MINHEYEIEDVFNDSKFDGLDDEMRRVIAFLILGLRVATSVKHDLAFLQNELNIGESPKLIEIVEEDLNKALNAFTSLSTELTEYGDQYIKTLEGSNQESGLEILRTLFGKE